MDRRYEESWMYILYAVDLFFVEVEYDMENKIVEKRAFVQGEIFDKYAGID